MSVPRGNDRTPTGGAGIACGCLPAKPARRPVGGESMAHRVRFAAVLLATCGLAAGPVEEKYPSGKIKRKYDVDDQGRKTGPYLEYHESGKLKIKASCKAGQWDGPYTSFHPGGKPHVTAT